MLKLRLVLSALILAGLAVIGYSRFQAAQAETNDCPILSVRVNEDAVPNDEGAIEITSENSTVRCFDTPAQSLRDVTDGEVDLPDDASQEEADAAYEVYYATQVARDASRE